MLTESQLGLAQRTDLAVARLMDTVVETRADHLLVRSPENPLFHFGNMIVVLDDERLGDVEHWLTVFRDELPDATWRAFALPGKPDLEVWGAHGFEPETETALVRTVASGRVEGTSAVEGYELSRLPETSDWMDLLPHGPVVDLVYLKVRGVILAKERRLAARGVGAWFGAKRDGRVVASLGIIDLGDGTARYRHVATDAEHRGRGLASWLLEEAAAWASECGAERLVIVADTGTDAERLYRARGFEPAGLAWQAYRRDA